MRRREVVKSLKFKVIKMRICCFPNVVKSWEIFFLYVSFIWKTLKNIMRHYKSRKMTVPGIYIKNKVLLLLLYPPNQILFSKDINDLTTFNYTTL